MEIVRVTGITGNVDKDDFAEEVKKIFGDNPDIGGFTVIRKDNNVFELVFLSSFDAIEGHRLLNKHTFTCPKTNRIHLLHAKIVTNRDNSVTVDRPYPSLEEYTSSKDVTESNELKYLKRKMEKLQQKLVKTKIKKEQKRLKKRLKTQRESDDKRSSRGKLLSGGSSDRSSHSSKSRNRSSSFKEMLDKETSNKNKRKYSGGSSESSNSSPSLVRRTSKKESVDKDKASYAWSVSSDDDDAHSSHSKRSKVRELSVDKRKGSSYKIPKREKIVSRESLSGDDLSPHKRRSKERELSVDKRKGSSYKIPKREKIVSRESLSGDDLSPHKRRSKERELSLDKRKGSSYKIPKREKIVSRESLSGDDLSPHKRRSKERELSSIMKRKESSYKIPKRNRTPSRQSLSNDDLSPHKRRLSPGFREPSVRRRPDVHESSARRRTSPYSERRSRFDDVYGGEGSSKDSSFRDIGSKFNDRGNKYKTTDRQLDSSPSSTEYVSKITTEEPNTSNNTNVQKKLLSHLNSTSHTFLHEHEVKLQNVVDELMNHVDLEDLPNFKCLQDSDKNIVYEALRRHVVNRLTNMKIPSHLDTVNIILDYKLKYETLIDKSLFNAVTTELISLGPEKAQSMNSDELSEVIDGVLKNVQIEKILEDTKPDVHYLKQEIKTEDTEDSEDAGSRRININIQLVAMEKESEDKPIDVEKIKQVSKAIKKIKPNKFYMPIKRIIRDMKRTIYDANVPFDILIEKLIQVLQNMIANLLIGSKKIRSEKVVARFRKAYPIEKDKEFVRNIGEWYMDGAFENEEVLGKLLIIKQENHEIEDGEISEEEEEDKHGDSIITKQERIDIKQEAVDIKTESQDKTTTAENPEPTRVSQELPDISEEMDKLDAVMNSVNKESVEPISVKQEIPDISEEMATIDEVIKTVNSENAESVKVKQEIPDISEEMEAIDHVITTINSENAESVKVKQEIPDITEEMETIDDVIKTVNSENAKSVRVKQEIPDISEDIDKVDDTVDPENVELIKVKQLPDLCEELDKIDDVINSCGDNNIDAKAKCEIKQEPMDFEEKVIVLDSEENSQDEVIILDSPENDETLDKNKQIQFFGVKSKNLQNIEQIPNNITQDVSLSSETASGNNIGPIVSQTKDNVSGDGVGTILNVLNTETIDDIKSYLIRQLTE